MTPGGLWWGVIDRAREYNARGDGPPPYSPMDLGR
jgi:hypothetical protein